MSLRMAKLGIRLAPGIVAAFDATCRIVNDSSIRLVLNSAAKLAVTDANTIPLPIAAQHTPAPKLGQEVSI